MCWPSLLIMGSSKCSPGEMALASLCVSFLRRPMTLKINKVKKTLILKFFVEVQSLDWQRNTGLPGLVMWEMDEYSLDVFQLDSSECESINNSKRSLSSAKWITARLQGECHRGECFQCCTSYLLSEIWISDPHHLFVFCQNGFLKIGIKVPSSPFEGFPTFFLRDCLTIWGFVRLLTRMQHLSQV